MSSLHKREPKRPIVYPDQARTLIDLRPPRFPDATPSPIIATAKPRAIASMLAENPNAIEIRPAPLSVAIDPASTMLGVIPRTAVMQAVARIEAKRAEGTSRHLVATPD